MSVAAEKNADREERVAERQAQRAHEAAMQRQILDWITVHPCEAGNVLVLTVPADKFAYPGTDPNELTDEQKVWREDCHRVLTTLLNDLGSMGKPLLGTIIGEGMKLEDLPPPGQMAQQRDPRAQVRAAGGRLILPPGTKI